MRKSLRFKKSAKGSPGRKPRGRRSNPMESIMLINPGGRVPGVHRQHSPSSAFKGRKRVGTTKGGKAIFSFTNKSGFWVGGGVNKSGYVPYPHPFKKTSTKAASSRKAKKATSKRSNSMRRSTRRRTTRRAKNPGINISVSKARAGTKVGKTRTGKTVYKVGSTNYIVSGKNVVPYTGKPLPLNGKAPAKRKAKKAPAKRKPAAKARGTQAARQAASQRAGSTKSGRALYTRRGKRGKWMKSKNNKWLPYNPKPFQKSKKATSRRKTTRKAGYGMRSVVSARKVAKKAKRGGYGRAAQSYASRYKLSANRRRSYRANMSMRKNPAMGELIKKPFLTKAAWATGGFVGSHFVGGMLDKGLDKIAEGQPKLAGNTAFAFVQEHSDLIGPAVSVPVIHLGVGALTKNKLNRDAQHYATLGAGLRLMQVALLKALNAWAPDALDWLHLGEYTANDMSAAGENAKEAAEKGAAPPAEGKEKVDGYGSYVEEPLSGYVQEPMGFGPLDQGMDGFGVDVEEAVAGYVQEPMGSFYNEGYDLSGFGVDVEEAVAGYVQEPMGGFGVDVEEAVAGYGVDVEEAVAGYVAEELGLGAWMGRKGRKLAKHARRHGQVGAALALGPMAPFAIAAQSIKERKKAQKALKRKAKYTVIPRVPVRNIRRNQMDSTAAQIMKSIRGGSFARGIFG